MIKKILYGAKILSYFQSELENSANLSRNTDLSILKENFVDTHLSS